MITVVLAEDHHIVRQGLRLLLEQENFQLVGEAGDGLEALRLVANTQPDVLILDLMIPRLHGLEVTRQIHQQYPHTRIVILSSHADEPYVMEALRYGASGYVLKDATSADLVKAIQEALAGRHYLSSALTERVITEYCQIAPKSAVDLYDKLTDRERLVLRLAAEGRTAAEIASKLFISERTVETHRANLMRKLCLHTQTDLVRYAIRKKILEP